MVDDYEWEVFISYRRADPVHSWVHKHFAKLLRDWLPLSLPAGHSCEIFLDEEMETGVDWPLSLQNALHRSRILVPILSPTYLNSEWCMAEFAAMQERERLCNFRTPDDPRGLIYPVLFHDGEHLPQYMNDIERQDLRDWASAAPNFDQTPDYFAFEAKMKEIAGEIGRLVTDVAPDWDSGWPKMGTPLVSSPPPAKFLRV